MYHSAILLLFQFFLCLYITLWFLIFLLCVLLLKYFLCIISLFASCEKLYLFRLVANAIDVTFSKGDAIAIDMQMTVNAVIIYLAIVLAGCVVVSIADSFAPKEIATRLRVSKAKGIFTQVIF